MKQAIKGWDSNLALMVCPPGQVTWGQDFLLGLTEPRIPREVIPSAVLAELLNVTEPSS